MMDFEYLKTLSYGITVVVVVSALTVVAVCWAVQVFANVFRTVWRLPEAGWPSELSLLLILLLANVLVVVPVAGLLSGVLRLDDLATFRISDSPWVIGGAVTFLVGMIGLSVLIGWRLAVRDRRRGLADVPFV